MAVPVRRPPGVSEDQDFKAQEYWRKSLHDQLRLVGTATVNMGSIASGARTSFTIAIEGARADHQQQVVLGLPSAWDTRLIPYGYVSADDEVTVVVYNSHSGSIDPDSMDIGARVLL